MRLPLKIIGLLHENVVNWDDPKSGRKFLICKSTITSTQITNRDYKKWKTMVKPRAVSNFTQCFEHFTRGVMKQHLDYSGSWDRCWVAGWNSNIAGWLKNVVMVYFTEFLNYVFFSCQNGKWLLPWFPRRVSKFCFLTYHLCKHTCILILYPHPALNLFTVFFPVHHRTHMWNTQLLYVVTLSGLDLSTCGFPKISEIQRSLVKISLWIRKHRWHRPLFSWDPRAWADRKGDLKTIQQYPIQNP